MNLSIKLPSVEQFYIEADKVEETGRLNIWEGNGWTKRSRMGRSI